MKHLKKTFKIFLIAIVSLVVFVVLYLLSAYALSRMAVAREENAANERTIFILTNGVHTDLVLPLRNEQMDWSKEIKFENTISKDTVAKFIALGWGDKGFYLETPTWADLKFSTAFKAAFGLSTSAIHATFYSGMKEQDNCKEIHLSKEQYERLIQYIKNSLILDANGHVLPITTNANYNKNDAFYEAKGSYSMFHTCNTWTNNGLKSCGQKASWWTPFDMGIFYHYKKTK